MAIKTVLSCLVLAGCISILWWRFIDLPDLLSFQDTFSDPLWLAVVFVMCYAIANLLILPATLFNLASGAVFGMGEGLLLATLACWLSAVVAFAIARKFGRSWLNQQLSEKFVDRWHIIEENLIQGGLGYILIARLLPVIPYGVVSLFAGCCAIKSRDYWLGTLMGTPLGLAPFVLIGYGGKALLVSQDSLPLWAAIAVVAVLGIVSIWYGKQTNREIT